MKTDLQAMRKRAGWKSAKEYAEHKGINVSTYTGYEQGRIMMTLAKAWEFADDFGCTLDELAGRTPPARSETTYADPTQEDLNRYYESMNTDGRNALVTSARLMAGSDEVRIEKISPKILLYRPRWERKGKGKR